MNDEHAELTKQSGSRLETQTPSCSTNEFTNNDHSFELDSMDVDIRNTITPCRLDTDGIVDSFRVHMAQGEPGKRDFFEKNQGKPGKRREFSDHFYNLRENSWNFILPNISDQIGGAIRISEASK